MAIFIKFTVNGQKYKVNECIPRNTSLNAYLRYYCCLPGTKAMCREGGCGACIVSVRAMRYPSKKTETFSVNSCLVLVFSCNGWDITTVEGLGNRRDGYDEIQTRIAGFNGTQCGYCTPGWVMHMNSLRDKNLTMAELEKSFACNTCRCTGYRPILDTIKSFGSDATPELCQRVKDIEELTSCNKLSQKTRKLSIDSSHSGWSIIDDVDEEKMICLDFGNCQYYKVYKENDIFCVFRERGVDSYMLLDGNTAKGLVENFIYPTTIIDISGVKSLKCYKYDQNLVLGANICLEDCIAIFKSAAKENTDFTYLSEFVPHFEVIAHIPVRKIASLAGNLMSKHTYPDYQSDVFLLFECVGAVVNIRTRIGSLLSMTLRKFLKFNMTGCVMVNIELPPMQEGSYIFKSYKIMPRSQNALAIVNAAFLLNVDSKKRITNASIVYGNIAPDFTHARQTELYLRSKSLWNSATLQGALQQLSEELTPAHNPPEPAPAARKKLALGLFYKFVLKVAPDSMVPPSYRSGGDLLTRPICQAKQDYETNPSLYPVNEPVQKLEALIQSSGEAVYVNDIPPQPREVFGAFVLSTICKGTVDKVYADDVLEIKGVIAILTARDIPGINSFILPDLTLQAEDEELLATEVKHYGQPVAIVVADSEELASSAAKKVRVTYKNICTAPPILTIDDAKKISSRYIPGVGIIKPTSRGNNVTKVIKGVYEIEGQYHYYIEPLTCLVVPVDNGLEVYDATQWMDLTQVAIARCLNISESKIVVKVNRLGGSFGGKVTRNSQVAAAAALVAHNLNRPCRFILPLQTNITIAGKRIPSQCEYEVGVDDNGEIQYLISTIIQDVGCSNNDNINILTAAGFPNCYDSARFSLTTGAVRTDTASNTFFRAPGSCEGIASVEHIMQHIAFAVRRDPLQVRLTNMRKIDNDLPEMIETLKKSANYEERLAAVKKFNLTNRWMKKSININVMSYPVIYYGNFTTLVSIYSADGTVSVTSGGIEVGQGINTKVAQVCARELDIPLKYVQVIPNYSFAAPNNIFTAGSVTSESICYSVTKACEILKERLAPIRADMENGSWESIVRLAGISEINLSASHMMNSKDLPNYNVFAVSMVELKMDILLGTYQMERVDILEDSGVSTNPPLDIGQVEGAFIQGMGYYTCEKLKNDKTTGKLLTNRSFNYHVPLCLDIPVFFNVGLRHNSKIIKGVVGAKAVGEMGICTTNGIPLALRDCIMASRKHSGHDPREWINIDIPCDTESMLKALDTKIEEFVLAY